VWSSEPGWNWKAAFLVRRKSEPQFPEDEEPIEAADFDEWKARQISYFQSVDDEELEIVTRSPRMPPPSSKFLQLPFGNTFSSFAWTKPPSSPLLDLNIPIPKPIPSIPQIQISQVEETDIEPPNNEINETPELLLAKSPSPCKSATPLRASPAFLPLNSPVIFFPDFNLSPLMMAKKSPKEQQPAVKKYMKRALSPRNTNKFTKKSPVRRPVKKKKLFLEGEQSQQHQQQPPAPLFASSQPPPPNYKTFVETQKSYFDEVDSEPLF
jgi:hypothetical protein